MKDQPERKQWLEWLYPRSRAGMSAEATISHACVSVEKTRAVVNRNHARTHFETSRKGATSLRNKNPRTVWVAARIKFCQLLL